MKEPGADDADLLNQLRAYTALDNPVRLRAFRLLHASPGMSFNEIAKELGRDTGLLAYHIGVLKAARLVDVTYVRQGRETTEYRLTTRGEGIHATLFPPKGRSARTDRRPRSHPAHAR